MEDWRLEVSSLLQLHGSDMVAVQDESFAFLNAVGREGATLLKIKPLANKRLMTSGNQVSNLFRQKPGQFGRPCSQLIL